jgi:hypothetical protein
MTHRSFVGKLGVLLLGLLAGACRGDAQKTTPSGGTPTASVPEVVNAGEPTYDSARPLAARFWVEAEPKEGRLHIFEIHPGNVIYRDQEILSPDFPESSSSGIGGRDGVTQIQQGLRYQHAGTPATLSTCTPGDSCVPAAGTVRIFNPPAKTTFVNDSAACFSNGGSCDGMAGRAPAPVGLPCTSSNTICAEIHMVSRYSMPLTNVVLDIKATTTPGGTACGVSPASPVIGCQPGTPATNLGICAHSNGNGQNKVNNADSNLTSCIPGGVMDTRPCSYCYGNTGVVDGLGAATWAGLKGAVMPNLSAVSHDATLKSVNTATTAMKLVNSNSLRLVFEVRYATPGLPAANQITYAFAGAGSCVNPVGVMNPTWVTLNGGSFGPPFACYGNPMTSCPLTDSARTSPPAAGSYVQINNILGGAPTVIADGLFKLWSDRQVAFNLAMGTSGTYTATLVTPLGQATTTQQFTTCAGGPNTWRSLTSTIETVQGIGGVLGGNIVVAGGRTDATDPSSVTAATRYFTIPTLATVSPLTVNAGPDMNVPRWGAASVVVGGRLYAIGGAQDGFFCLDSTESWDGAAGAWTDHGIALPEGRCGASAIAIGGLIYLTGGSTSSVPGFFGAMMASTNTCVLNTANIPAGWDCATYTGGDDISVTSRLSGGYASTGSRGLIVGGLDSGLSVLSAVETMTEVAATPAFVGATALPAGRSLPGVASANTFFYVMGGSATGGEGDAGSATLHRTPNGAPGAWTAMASAPVARQGHVLVAATCMGCTAQKLYAIGGSNSGSNISGVDEYTE